MSDQPASAEELRKAQEKEYGMYVAVEPIMVGNALAFNTGDPVPISHVEGKNALPHIKESVARRNTVAGKRALGLPDAEEEPSPNAPSPATHGTKTTRAAGNE